MRPECLSHFTRCPICDSDLTPVGNSVACANRHSFDVAREGYVNFQAALGRISKSPGDTKEMLVARTAFIQRGFYRPLNEAIDEIVEGVLGKRTESVSPSGPAGVLDAGCGEGYVLGSLKACLDARMPDRKICYFGSDVSRDAIRRSARIHPEILFVVASTMAKLPFISIDVILNTFAPRNPAEFHRITAPAGVVVVVIPTSRHLVQARQAFGLLGIQEEKERRVVEQFDGLFRLASSQTLEFEMSLERPDLKNLILMSPNYWHQTQEIAEKVEAMDGLETTASFTLLVFRRIAVVNCDEGSPLTLALSVGRGGKAAPVWNAPPIIVAPPVG